MRKNAAPSLTAAQTRYAQSRYDNFLSLRSVASPDPDLAQMWSERSATDAAFNKKLTDKSIRKTAQLEGVTVSYTVLEDAAVVLVYLTTAASTALRTWPLYGNLADLYDQLPEMTDLLTPTLRRRLQMRTLQIVPVAEGVDFRNRTAGALPDNEIEGCVFLRCNFVEPMANRVFDTCVFHECAFLAKSAIRPGLRNVLFNNCDFTGSRFDNVLFEGVEFKVCNLSRASFLESRNMAISLLKDGTYQPRKPVEFDWSAEANAMEVTNPPLELAFRYCYFSNTVVQEKGARTPLYVDLAFVNESPVYDAKTHYTNALRPEAGKQPPLYPALHFPFRVGFGTPVLLT